MSTILIIDDDRALCRSLEIQLGAEGHAVRVAHSAAQGMTAMRTGMADMVFLDLGLPDRSGLEVLETIRAEREDLPVVIITGQQETRTAIQAMRSGAFDYLRKPFDLDDLILLVQKVERHREQSARPAAGPLYGSVPESGAIIGSDRKILEALKAIGLLSRSQVTVLIEGETGTGKELAARALHEASAPGEPFVAVNCSALVGTLLESELFGHEKGAFTGAVARKNGKLEHAGSGTVFLDEIGDMPLDIQAKVLRVLQEREFERVGGLEEVPFRARVAAATNRDLGVLVHAGKFREDLFYRLTVSRIYLPPLRERKGDIPAIGAYLVERISRKLHSRVAGIDKAALDVLKDYDWPGNVRELENVLTRAVALARGIRISHEEIRSHLIPRARGADQERGIRPLREAEKEYISGALAAEDWNILRTAGKLEISPTTLRKKIKDYDLQRKS